MLVVACCNPSYQTKLLDISHASEVLGHEPKDVIGGEDDICTVPEPAPLYAA